MYVIISLLLVAAIALLITRVAKVVLTRPAREDLPMTLTRLLLRIGMRVPVAGKLISFYRHIAFDLPRLTTLVGVGLLLGIAAIRLYLLAEFGLPAYLAAYFVLIGVLASVAALGMLAGRWLSVVRTGWALGSLVALASLLMYLASRTVGLPGLAQLIGRWDYAPGTFAIALSGAFLTTHFAVLTRMTVAYPQHQRWHD